LVQQDLYNKGIKSIISKTKMSRKTILVLALAVIAIIVVFIVLKGGI
jgi:1,4-dihydroxy-2-naphthoate octaprenyltransferase